MQGPQTWTQVHVLALVPAGSSLTIPTLGSMGSMTGCLKSLCVFWEQFF